MIKQMIIQKVKLNRPAFAGTVLLAILFFIAPQQFHKTEKGLHFPENYQRNENLQAEADSLLELFDKMPAVPVFLKDEPVIKNGTNSERGVGYTYCRAGGEPEIFIKKIFYETANSRQLTNILKHELTHAWLCRQGKMSGHDDNFRRKFTEVGGFGN
jgi:hypothetical protein